MMMRKPILAILTTCLLAPAVLLAQEAAPTQQAPAGDNQRQGGRGGPGRRDMVAWFMRDLDENVGLTGQQKKQLQEMLDKLRQEAMEQFRNNPPNPETWQTFRALRQQQEQAAAAGDEAKVQEIQKQLDNQGPAGMFREMRSRAMDDVSKVLTADQQEAFEQWRTLRESNLPPPLVNDPEALKNAINGISTLSDVQRNSLEAAFGRYNDRAGAMTGDDPVERNKLRNHLVSAVQRILKPGQQVLMMSSFRQQMMQQRRNAGASQPAAQGAGASPHSGDTATSSTVQASTSQAPASPAINPLDADAWTTYVRTFVTRCNLDEIATETAYDILQELRTRRDIYLSSHRTDLEEIDRKLKLAGSQEEQTVLQEDRKALQQPIADMFQELKDRLDALPAKAQSAASQSAATSQAATSTQPTAGNRSPGTQLPRQDRSVSTQSAG